jgi:hypothetical protein
MVKTKMRCSILSAWITAMMMWGSVAIAKEPFAVFGYGTTKCVAFVNMSRNKESKFIADLVFGWVQGWFSARNASGINSKSPRTVGGSLSADTLREFLIRECEEHPNDEVVIVADGLYDRLAEKGL